MSKVTVDQPVQLHEASVSRVEFAYRKIKTRITTNEFPSNYQVLEPELATQLGVSRTPVREALIRLEADNLIELIPRKGMRVLPISAADIEELQDLTLNLELLAIKKICNCDKQFDFGVLDDILQLLIATTDDDRELRVATEDRFFLELVALVKSVRLVGTLENFYDQFRRARYLTLDFISESITTGQSCEKLLVALKEKDLASAESLHRAYRSSLSEAYKNAQQKYQLQEL